MIEGAVKYIFDKGLEAALKGKKVDVQLNQCYASIFKEFIKTHDLADETAKEAINRMLSGLSMFDSYGNPEKMYASLCLYFNSILSKNEFNYYIDRLIRNIVAHPELCTYVNIPVFKENVIKDFNPEKVSFRKTKFMVYHHFPTMTKQFKQVFKPKSGTFTKEIHPGTVVINELSAVVDCSKPVYVYAFNQECKTILLAKKRISVNSATRHITVTVDEPCYLFLTNDKIQK